MNNIEKIKYTQELLKQKEEIINLLKKLDEQIEINQLDCMHVALDQSKCLICGKEFSKNVSGTFEYRYNIETSLNLFGKKFEEKYDIVQTLYLGLLKALPDFTNSEIINIINDIISQNLICEEFKKEKKLMK